MAEQNINPEDQILIPGVKNILKQVLALFFGAFSFFAFVAQKRKLMLLVGLLCGLLLGYIYYTTKSRSYKVSMVVVFNELTKGTYAEILDQLNRLVATGSRKRLAAELKIPDGTAAGILSINARNMNDEALRLDTSSKTKQPFKILVSLNNNKSTDSLQIAIINYLNNSPYLKKLKEDQRKNYLARIAFIDNELAKLDSLKSEYNRFLSSSKISATYYNNAFDPADIYVHSSSLVNQKQSLLSSLNMDGTAVSVVDGFKVTSSPQSASLLKYLLAIGGIGLIAAFILGVLVEAEKRISRK